MSAGAPCAPLGWRSSSAAHRSSHGSSGALTNAWRTRGTPCSTFWSNHMPQDPRRRRQGLPTRAGQARQRTEETAHDYAETLRQVLTMLEQIQAAAWDNPKLVYELAILAQRDVALTIAALADIQRWMVEVALGKPAESEERR